MKTITFSIMKGGVGKTSTSVSVARELAKKYKVVLIDGDSQGNATSWIYTENIENQLIDVLNESKTVEDTCYQTKFENLFIIPSDRKKYDTVTKQKLNILDDNPYLISDICEKLSKYFDYCIIDTSPNMSKFEKACYLASDELIPVVLPDSFSAEGLTIYLENILSVKKAYRSEKAMLCKKIIINKINNIKKVSKTYQDIYNNAYNEFELFKIPTDSGFEKAQVVHYFIQDLNPKKNEIKQETLDEFSRLSDSL